MGVLDEVYTFAEANELLGTSEAFLNKLVHDGKLVKGLHWREARRNRLITKEAIIRIGKIRGKVVNF